MMYLIKWKGSEMLNSLMNLVFGCPHRRTTFPMTPGRRSGFAQHASAHHGTYVVCLDCGKEFDYDWSEMRIGAPVTASITTGTLSTALR
jgi:hypothetical protein